MIVFRLWYSCSSLSRLNESKSRCFNGGNEALRGCELLDKVGRGAGRLAYLCCSVEAIDDATGDL